MPLTKTQLILPGNITSDPCTCQLHAPLRLAPAGVAMVPGLALPPSLPAAKMGRKSGFSHEYRSTWQLRVAGCEVGRSLQLTVAAAAVSSRLYQQLWQ